jgi:NAD(P)-dependent dehydrogenase (short-subunit alcohol dehydrogenase family)
MPRRILITGGTGTIGSAIARHFAAAGDHVAIASRSGGLPADLANLAPAVAAFAVDVRDAEAVRRTVDAASQRLGGFDILVIAAGVWAATPFDGGEESDDAWHSVIETMLSGAWWTVQAALPHLADHGRVVVITATPERTAYAGNAAFAAAAHGLIGMVRSLALDLAPRRITVNAVAPAWVPGALAAAALPATPLGAAPPWTEAEAVAQLVAFLCSDVAGGITAQVYGLPGVQET